MHADARRVTSELMRRQASRARRRQDRCRRGINRRSVNNPARTTRRACCVGAMVAVWQAADGVQGPGVGCDGRGQPGTNGQLWHGQGCAHPGGRDSLSAIAFALEGDPRDYDPSAEAVTLDAKPRADRLNGPRLPLVLLTSAHSVHGRVDAALVSAQIAQIRRHRRRRLTRPAIAPIGGIVRVPGAELITESDVESGRNTAGSPFRSLIGVDFSASRCAQITVICAPPPKRIDRAVGRSESANLHTQRIGIGRGLCHAMPPRAAWAGPAG
jgi:hypothetical protein